MSNWAHILYVKHVSEAKDTRTPVENGGVTHYTAEGCAMRQHFTTCARLKPARWLPLMADLSASMETGAVACTLKDKQHILLYLVSIFATWKKGSMTTGTNWSMKVSVDLCPSGPLRIDKQVFELHIIMSCKIIKTYLKDFTDLIKSDQMCKTGIKLKNKELKKKLIEGKVSSEIDL